MKRDTWELLRGRETKKEDTERKLINLWALDLISVFFSWVLCNECRGKEKEPRKITSSFTWFRSTGELLAQKTLDWKSWKVGEEEGEPELQRYLGKFNKGKIRKDVQLVGSLEWTSQGDRGRESVRCFLSVLQCITHLPCFKRALHLLSKEINLFHTDL